MSMPKSIFKATSAKKMIDSKNIVFEAQFKNFLFHGNSCSVLEIFIFYI